MTLRSGQRRHRNRFQTEAALGETIACCAAGTTYWHLNSAFHSIPGCIPSTRFGSSPTPTTLEEAMAWSDLCGGSTVDGKKIDLKTLLGADVDHDKRGKSGLPEAAVLAKMVDKAGGLKLKAAPDRRGGRSTGISFTVAEGTIDAQNNVNAAEKFKNFVSEKGGAGVCYEDTFLPLAVPNRHVLVHQSVAPCKRCRAGYKAWAQQLRSTIVVSADDGYDGAPGNSTFIFSPTGLVFYG